MNFTAESWLALLLLGSAVVLAWRFLMGRQLLITAPAAFLIYQAPNVLGVVVESSRMPVFRSDWPVLVAAGFLMFVIGGIVANFLYGFNPEREVALWRASPIEYPEGETRVRWFFVWFMIVVSVVAGVLFYRAVGYNSLFDQLKRLVSGSGISYADFYDQRIGVLSDGYRAAGYTLQFIGIIFPTLIVYLWVESRLRDSSRLRNVSLLLMVAAIFFVTIQGGRTYILAMLVLVLLSFGQDMSPLPPRFRLSRLVTGLLIFGFVLAFGVISDLQGRGADDPDKAGISQIVGDIWERVGGDYSRTQMVALEALEPEVPVYGAQWFSQLEVILPGPPSAGESFDVRVYRIIYGTSRGNNPLDPWGSYYYNFGVAGLILVPFFLGLFAQALSIGGLIRARRNAATIVIMSALGYRFMFVIDPYSLFLVGPFTLLFLNTIMRVLAPSVPNSRHLGGSAQGGHESAGVAY